MQLSKYDVQWNDQNQPRFLIKEESELSIQFVRGIYILLEQGRPSVCIRADSRISENGNPDANLSCF